jgi:hypothetical protein
MATPWLRTESSGPSRLTSRRAKGRRVRVRSRISPFRLSHSAQKVWAPGPTCTSAAQSMKLSS